jgi:hypothetical protein
MLNPPPPRPGSDCCCCPNGCWERLGGAPKELKGAVDPNPLPDPKVEGAGALPNIPKEGVVGCWGGAACPNPPKVLEGREEAAGVGFAPKPPNGEAKVLLEGGGRVPLGMVLVSPL